MLEWIISNSVGGFFPHYLQQTNQLLVLSPTQASIVGYQGKKKNFIIINF